MLGALAPPGQSALDYFRSALKLHDSNEKALAGIARVVSAHLGRVDTVMLEQRFGDAEKEIVAAGVILPKSRALAAATKRLVEN